ncbi:nuclear transport factor 2 family protein [Catenulispora pinisilvae]|uniref:nuclear transport factor 2 family protein n=1 Tax=Catenulispora pinisilvae TaxID=2705253 RepID=UPI00189124F9|nr:nuclear transport factor 2 family protein [Catenulispora pinisilvae]
MSFATPADLLDRRRQVILDGDADGFADLFAPDAVIEMPFEGTPEAPLRLAGREAIGEYARRMMASPLRIEDFDVTAVHQTQDPEVIVVEVDTKGSITTTGKPFSVTSVQILRIRDGRIALFRAYGDPRLGAQLRG